MAARDGERLSRSYWKLMPGTDGYELVAGPFHPSADADSPKPADEREKE